MKCQTKVSIFIKYTNETDEIRICEKYLFVLNLSYNRLSLIITVKKTVIHSNWY